MEGAQSRRRATPAERRANAAGAPWSGTNQGLRDHAAVAVLLGSGLRAPAPFRTSEGPYLEPHHVRRLSDGGPDHPRWVIALCANCHGRAHYSEDASTYNAHLTSVVEQLEGAL